MIVMAWARGANPRAKKEGKDYYTLLCYYTNVHVIITILMSIFSYQVELERLAFSDPAE